jgi:integrase
MPDRTVVVPSSDRERHKLDPTRRWPTRHRGLSFRLNRRLERSYFVHDRGKFVPAGKTETEALAKQAEIRGRRAKGERVIVASRVHLSAVAEEWYADARRRLRESTAKDYRSYLERVLLPRFGQRGIGSIAPQDIVDLVRDLEAKGKSPSTIANTLKPLAGTLNYAVFKGLIAVTPMAQVPRGYKPSCNATREHREWMTAEVDRMIAEARKLDARSEARQSYGLAIEILLRCGLRLGECLGLRFGDVNFAEGVLISVTRGRRRARSGR